MSINHLAPYDHPADIALLGSTPMFMAPRFGKLPDIQPGQLRHIAASDGIYLEARSNAMHVVSRISKVALPYGPLAQSVRLIGGPIPEGLIEQATQAAKHAVPNEWAGLILFRCGHYELWEPQAEAASPSRITYLTHGVDPLDVAVDIHSHGTGRAFFSATDDRDDAAHPAPCVISVVLGGCHLDQPSSAVRYIVGGRFISTRWSPFEQPEGHLSRKRPGDGGNLSGASVAAL